jgi:hypothetical protein
MGGFRYGFALNRTSRKDKLKPVKYKCDVSFLWVISLAEQQRTFGQSFERNFFELIYPKHTSQQMNFMGIS